jgi:hypothetical protein
VHDVLDPQVPKDAIVLKNVNETTGPEAMVNTTQRKMRQPQQKQQPQKQKQQQTTTETPNVLPQPHRD